MKYYVTLYSLPTFYQKGKGGESKTDGNPSSFSFYLPSRILDMSRLDFPPDCEIRLSLYATNLIWLIPGILETPTSSSSARN